MYINIYEPEIKRKEAIEGIVYKILAMPKIKTAEFGISVGDMKEFYQKTEGQQKSIYIIDIMKENTIRYDALKMTERIKFRDKESEIVFLTSQEFNNKMTFQCKYKIYDCISADDMNYMKECLYVSISICINKKILDSSIKKMSPCLTIKSPYYSIRIPQNQIKIIIQEEDSMLCIIKKDGVLRAAGKLEDLYEQLKKFETCKNSVVNLKLVKSRKKRIDFKPEYTKSIIFEFEDGDSFKAQKEFDYKWIKKIKESIDNVYSHFGRH